MVSRFLVFFFLCFVLFLQCAPLKNEVESSDLDRVLERMAERKVQINLALSEGERPPSDRKIFDEVCEIYRLDPTMALSRLKEKNPDLASSLEGSP